MDARLLETEPTLELSLKSAMCYEDPESLGLPTIIETVEGFRLRDADFNVNFVWLQLFSLGFGLRFRCRNKGFNNPNLETQVRAGFHVPDGAVVRPKACLCDLVFAYCSEASKRGKKVYRIQDPLLLRTLIRDYPPLEPVELRSGSYVGPARDLSLRFKALKFSDSHQETQTLFPKPLFPKPLTPKPRSPKSPKPKPLCDLR